MTQQNDGLTLKELVDFLFETVKRPDGGTYSMQEVADELSISAATINQLRTGRGQHPTLPTLKELSRFFNVPLSYFECKSYDECYARLREGRVSPDSSAAQIAFRASQLSPKAQEKLLDVLLWVEAADRQRVFDSDLPDLPEDMP